MTKVQAKRLLKLVAFLETVKPKQFNMAHFAGESKTCGTVCCALGWAGMKPEFRRLGLKTDALTNNVSFNGFDELDGINEEGEYCDWTGARTLFGLESSECDWLFLPSGYTSEFKWIRNVKPSHVIARIRKIVCEKHPELVNS